MLARVQRGDTIIEVLLAVTVFSLVAVGSMTIMNRSANAAQQAIEITLVRQQIDAQVEALKASNQAYSRLVTTEARESSSWRSLMETEPGHISTSDGCPEQQQLNTEQAYIMNPLSATVLMGADQVLSIDNEGSPIFPQIVENGDFGGLQGYGLWIERHNAGNGTSGDYPTAYDFRVRACWYGAGMGTTPMEIETVVRLYDGE